MGLSCCELNEIPSPFIDLHNKPDAALACTPGKVWFDMKTPCATGTLDVHHFRTADDILPNLPAFFEQHFSGERQPRMPACFVKNCMAYIPAADA